MFSAKKHEILSEMGPYGSVGAHIKTGRSPIAQDHFKTPPDSKMAHKDLKMTQKSWLGSCWDNSEISFLVIFRVTASELAQRATRPC